MTISFNQNIECGYLLELAFDKEFVFLCAGLIGGVTFLTLRGLLSFEKAKNNFFEITHYGLSLMIIFFEKHQKSDYSVRYLLTMIDKRKFFNEYFRHFQNI